MGRGFGVSAAVSKDVIEVGPGGGHDALARVRAGVGELGRETSAAIVVGALGPRMAQLAGEVADGVLLN